MTWEMILGDRQEDISGPVSMKVIILPFVSHWEKEQKRQEIICLFVVSHDTSCINTMISQKKY